MKPSIILLTFLAFAVPSYADTWRLVRKSDGWQLLRDGEPFEVRGAVAPSQFDILGARGGNAVRIIRPTKQNLDAAHFGGLAVMANLPVRGERNDIDWGSEEQVERQKQQALDIVRELKDHPAVMFWSVGNELDHVPGRKGYDPRLWERLNEVAKAVKKIDPEHLVMTAIGTGRLAEKIEPLAAAGTDFDLLGINSYGDIDKIGSMIGPHWNKPYVVTEWGPTGHWQVPRTAWGAPIEETSSEKAAAFARRYPNALPSERGHCLGSFAFYWSEKQETTHTWYGLFLDGLQTESIDVLQHLWTGEWPKNRAPQVTALSIEGFADPRNLTLKPGANHRASVGASDPDGDQLSFHWDIRSEVVIPKNSYAGGLEKRAKPIPGLIAEPNASMAAFTAPENPGAYRLFVTATDGRGHIAYGNIPFQVKPK